MPTYSVLYAEDVPHYATVDIEAGDDAKAIELATPIPANGRHQQPKE